MKSPLLQALAILLLAALAGTATALWHPRRPVMSNHPSLADDWAVTLEQAEKWEEESGIVWIDARSEEEFKKDALPGAYLVTEKGWSEQLFEVFNEIDEDKYIIVYCGTRQCDASKQIAQRFRETTPFQKAYYLRGGYRTLRGRIR